MIRSADRLCSIVERGFTVSRQPAYDSPRTDLALVITETGEAVHAAAFSAALKREKLTVVTTDMFGEPYQYGAAQ